MLPISIPPHEGFDSATNSFINMPGAVLKLEHSLISISKWESKWKKSFISSNEFTRDELLDYVRFMTINQISDGSVYNRLTQKDMEDIRTYIDDSHTATTIRRDSNQRRRNRIITSEQIYGWMVYYGIPFDPCEKWHINRLLMLIEVCGVQQSGGTKMSSKERGEWMRAQHAKRSRGKH